MTTTTTTTSKKTIGLMIKTTALHVHHTFWYISLTSTAGLQRLKERKFIFLLTFSLPSSSSLLTVPINWNKTHPAIYLRGSQVLPDSAITGKHNQLKTTACTGKISSKVEFTLTYSMRQLTCDSPNIINSRQFIAKTKITYTFSNILFICNNQ